MKTAKLKFTGKPTGRNKMIALAVTFAILIFSFSFNAKTEISLGPKLGVAFTSFSGSNIGDIKSKTNWVAGLFLNVQLTSSIVLQPELLFSKKGAIQTQNGSSNNISINYFEVPILAKYRIPIVGVFYPNFFMGPDFAFKTKSSFSSTNTLTGESVQVNSGDIKKSDIGGIFGAGIDIKALGLMFTLDGRYNIGFSNLVSSGNAYNLDIRNKGWTISAGVGIRF